MLINYACLLGECWFGALVVGEESFYSPLYLTGEYGMDFELHIGLIHLVH